MNSTQTANQKDQSMDAMTASIIDALRSNESVQTFNSVFAEALEIDNKIETAMRGPECIDCDEVFKMHAEGRRHNSRLYDLASQLKSDFAAAGVRVESEWGQDGDWAIFLSPHNVPNSRTAQFLLTSRLTVTR